MSGEDGARVYLVEWMPGTNTLMGTCFCAAQMISQDPNELWDWLHGHPDGHV